MPQRFRAPAHTSAVSAPTRVIQVGRDGTITLPDSAPDVEIEYLRRAGCVPVAAGAVESAPTSDSKPSAAQGGQKAAKSPKSPEIPPSGDVSGKTNAKT